MAPNTETKWKRTIATNTKWYCLLPSQVINLFSAKHDKKHSEHNMKLGKPKYMCSFLLNRPSGLVEEEQYAPGPRTTANKENNTPKKPEKINDYVSINELS